MTTGFVGMDRDSVRDLAQGLSTAAGRLSGIVGEVDSSLSRARWEGHDGEQFRHEWQSAHGRALMHVGSGLRELAACTSGAMRQWADALSMARWTIWQAQLAWPTAGGELEVRNLIVLDTEEGLLRAAPEPSGQVTLTPVTPSDIWRLLIRILPSDADLAAMPGRASLP